MGEWINIVDDEYAEIPDPIYRRVVDLGDLKQKRLDLLSNGVKEEPDAETLEFFNRMKGLEQQALILDQIDKDIAEIEAL